METKRDGFGSNFGFIMAAVGSAVGLGNIWGFPYKMGRNGGFSFLLIYLVLAVFVGLAVMVGELAIGRKTGKSPIAAYRAMSKKFAWMGYIAVAVPFLVLCFYFVLGGMVMRYAGGYLLAMFGVNTFGDDITKFFGSFICNGGSMVLWTAIFIALNAFIVSRGVGGGIEKFCNIGMPCLFVILVIVIVYVACQPGAMGGYKFMYGWNLDPLKENFLEVLKTAAGQMFFSLSLGMGAIITYGSYLSKKEKLQKNAVIIVIMDTMVALMAGMIVMPACFAFLGGNTSGGPGLLFASMQCVFDAMGGFIGNLMGFLFYFLVFIAAISSSMSLLEAITAARVDANVEKGKAPKRGKTAIIFAVIVFVFCIPTALDGLGSGVNDGAVLGNPAEILGTAWAQEKTDDGFKYSVPKDMEGFEYTYKFFPSNTTELGEGTYYTKGADDTYTLVEAGAEYDASTAYYTRADYYTASAAAKPDTDPENKGGVYDVSAALVEAGAEFDANTTYYQRADYKVLNDGKYSSVGAADEFNADTTYYSKAVKGWNCDWLDFYDMLSEGILMPLGALVMAFAIGWIWKMDVVVEECEQCGAKFWGKGFFQVCYKFITPIGMVFVLYGQITGFFG